MTDEPHPATLPIEELRKQCTLKRVRRSGPGGQHRNKVETGVKLQHLPTGIQAEANERRSQAENLAVAWQRLRVQLALEVRQPSKGGQPSELWNSRLVGQAIAVNVAHPDYPTLLAEALDVLAGANWDDAQAATMLGISRSQFTRFLRREPSSLALLNEERVARGMKRLV